jgi:hypothetical protein
MILNMILLANCFSKFKFLRETLLRLLFLTGSSSMDYVKRFIGPTMLVGAPVSLLSLIFSVLNRKKALYEH